MGTKRADIRGWINRDRDDDYSHMIVFCDTFDGTDYPVFVPRGTDPREFASAHVSRTEMTRIMECYNLDGNIEEQLSEHRANHWD